MKIIRKKSIVSLPKATGSISDTWNVEDEVTNAPSIRLLKEQLSKILLQVYPIGSYYWSDDPTDPSELFGGTWERVKDKFLYALGDEGNAGDEGGEATHTLTTNEMPSHTHTQNSHNHTQNAHQHTGFESSVNGGSYINIGGAGGSNNTTFHFSEGKSYYTGTFRTKTATATNQATTATNQNTGGGAAHNNMPPYVKAYCWKRIDPNAKKMINFSIYTREYEAEEGMTFYEWINSNYNTDGWKSETSGDYVTNDTLSPGKTLYVNAPNGGGSYLLSSETIIADYVYSQYAEK